MARNAAFEVLYREYYVRVFGLCRRLLNSSEAAEDATQEAFMRAYRTFNKYDSAQPFWRWISAIASNHCVDRLRKDNRAQDLFVVGDAEIEEVAGALPEPPSEIVAAQDAQRLSGAIAQLTDKFRVPLVLAYFNDRSYDEIAEQLGISRSHVGVLLVRAKTQLRELLVGDVS